MELTLFIMIILIASILQTSTGFGFSILAMPFLLFLFEPGEAIQINLILSLLISVSLWKTVQQDVDVSMLKRLLVGSIVGLPIGISVFLWLNMQHLKWGIGLLILVLTVLLMFSFRIRKNDRKDRVIGGLSGLLTTGIGMPGPPLLLYFSGTATEKERLRGTTLTYYLFIYFLSLLIQVLFAGTSKVVWLSSLGALPLVAIGMYLGQWLFKRISQRLFRLVTHLILLFTAAYLLLEGIVF